ncbi:MAG: tRNA pseudouridine(13) synthase TruD [Phycisphaerae bacterium]
MENPANNLPYLTADLPGIGGHIKQRPEDFRVDELPLYEPSGEGTHLYFRVQKIGVPTPAAAGRIARHMGVPLRQIGFAGLKDARAVTTQTMSLEHADPSRLKAFADPQVRVTHITRHSNKLRSGHLRGNRFRVRIRGVCAGALHRAQAVLEVLRARGVPNYFGPQRFGSRGDTAQLGRALLTDDLEEFVAILLGRPDPNDPPGEREARAAFDAGDPAAAAGHWPHGFADQRRALQAYARRGRPKDAVSAIDKRMRRLYVSALQSAVFNDVLARRIDAIDRVQYGDLAKKTDTGGVFLVEDPQAEQPRAERFEISPTGPIPGTRSRLAAGEPGSAERDAIGRCGLEVSDFDRAGSLRLKGARRALRFALEQPELETAEDENGTYLELRFSALSGSYATVVVREITKSDDLPDGEEDSDEPGED